MWGAMRALPAADEASRASGRGQKLACERKLQFLGTATGRNEAAVSREVITQIE